MAALRTMLTEREIPVQDNVGPLRRELDAPGRLTLEDLLRVPPNPNFVMHESAHAVAFSSLFGGDARALELPPTLSAAQRRERILRTQLCESFANACGVHAQAGSTTGVGSLFLRCNFYGSLADESRRQWRALVQAYGGAKTLALGALAFLRFNFLCKATPRNEFRRCMARLGMNARSGSKIERAAEGIFALVHKLHPGFLLLSTRFYYRQQGLTIDLRRALDFDFMAMLEKSTEIWERFLALGQFAADDEPQTQG